MPSEASPAPSFEQALSDLQRIAADLESGQLGLEDSLAQFERGVGLLRVCRRVLDEAERKIEILTGVDAAGNPTFAPFDATATAHQQGATAGRRPRRRTKAGAESTSEKGTLAEPGPAVEPAPQPARPTASEGAQSDSVRSENLPTSGASPDRATSDRASGAVPTSSTLPAPATTDSTRTDDDDDADGFRLF